MAYFVEVQTSWWNKYSAFVPYLCYNNDGTNIDGKSYSTPGIYSLSAANWRKPLENPSYSYGVKIGTVSIVTKDSPATYKEAPNIGYLSVDVDNTNTSEARRALILPWVGTLT